MDRFFFLVMFFIVVAIISIKKIKNLNHNEKDEVKNEFRKPLLIFIEAVPLIGVLLVFIGLFLEASNVTLTGIALMALGVLVTFILEINRDNIKQAIYQGLLNLIVIVYIYVFMYN